MDPGSGTDVLGVPPSVLGRLWKPPQPSRGGERGLLLQSLWLSQGFHTLGVGVLPQSHGRHSPSTCGQALRL